MCAQNSAMFFLLLLTSASVGEALIVGSEHPSGKHPSKALTTRKTCPDAQHLAPVGGRPVDGYGRWWLCAASLPQHPVVMSLGVGEDVSFDKEMVEKLAATVHAYDPTPKSAQYIAAQRKVVGGNWMQHFEFEALGVGKSDGTATFVLPENPNFVSGRVEAGCKNCKRVQVQIRALKSLMDSVGGKVDILKMDVEGAEYGALEYLMRNPNCSALPFSQLLIEYHDLPKHIADMEKHKSALEKCGLTRFKVGPEEGVFVFVPTGL